MRKLLSALLTVLLTSPVYAQTSNFYVNSSNGEVGIGTTSPIVSLDISHQTDALALPIGTTGTRPTGANLTNGEIRYNTTTPAVESYVNGSWISLGTGTGTVNSGTQYQLGYYANTGSTISGSSSVTTDASGNLTVSGSITPSQTGGIIGTTTNNNAAYGSVGEEFHVNCNNNNNFGTGSTITVTIASPAVVTWTGYPMSGYGPNTGSKTDGAFSGWTCPIYLTTSGALPTGLAANTTYWIIPLTANTFELASSSVNALAGTAINTTGTQSGTQTAIGYGYLPGTTNQRDAGAVTLTAGDWDVSGCYGTYVTAGVTLSTTTFAINTTTQSIPSQPYNGVGVQQQALIPNTSGSVTEVLCTSVGQFLLSGSSGLFMTGALTYSGGSGIYTYGSLHARRMR